MNGDDCKETIEISTYLEGNDITGEIINNAEGYTPSAF